MSKRRIRTPEETLEEEYKILDEAHELPGDVMKRILKPMLRHQDLSSGICEQLTYQGQTCATKTVSKTDKGSVNCNDYCSTHIHQWLRSIFFEGNEKRYGLMVPRIPRVELVDGSIHEPSDIFVFLKQTIQRPENVPESEDEEVEEESPESSAYENSDDEYERQQMMEEELRNEDLSERVWRIRITNIPRPSEPYKNDETTRVWMYSNLRKNITSLDNLEAWEQRDIWSSVGEMGSDNMTDTDLKRIVKELLQPEKYRVVLDMLYVVNLPHRPNDPVPLPIKQLQLYNGAEFLTYGRSAPQFTEFITNRFHIPFFDDRPYYRPMHGQYASAVARFQYRNFTT